MRGGLGGGRVNAGLYTESFNIADIPVDWEFELTIAWTMLVDGNTAQGISLINFVDPLGNGALSFDDTGLINLPYRADFDKDPVVQVPVIAPVWLIVPLLVGMFWHRRRAERERSIRS